VYVNDDAEESEDKKEVRQAKKGSKYKTSSVCQTQWPTGWLCVVQPQFSFAIVAFRYGLRTTAPKPGSASANDRHLTIDFC
jgi:hypothetical protein